MRLSILKEKRIYTIVSLADAYQLLESVNLPKGFFNVMVVLVDMMDFFPIEDCRRVGVGSISTTGLFEENTL
ncbi:hypothetical protein KRR40_42735 [Niabella defluvii]|nr:hypothetical protein KRR40_42735 [Niabella sp. I65]